MKIQAFCMKAPAFNLTWTDLTGFINLSGLTPVFLSRLKLVAKNPQRLIPLAGLIAILSSPSAYPSSFLGLGDLTGNGVLSEALGVSADGNVIVGHSYSGSLNEAFRWAASTGMVGLGYLPHEPNPFGSASQSEARAASADGSVVVGFDSAYRTIAPDNRSSYLKLSAGRCRAVWRVSASCLAATWAARAEPTQYQPMARS